eukprot:3903493-Rhodomonas_salina.1
MAAQSFSSSSSSSSEPSSSASSPESFNSAAAIYLSTRLRCVFGPQHSPPGTFTLSSRAG